MTCEQAREQAAGYVLGALDQSEELAVREHLAACPEPHVEFEELGGIVPALLELEDLELVEPPAGLRDRIMAAAAADLAERQGALARPAVVGSTMASAGEPPALITPAEPIPFPAAAEREARRDRFGTSRFDWALRVAAVIAIVAVGTWGLGLQGQLDASRRFDNAVAQVVAAAAEPGAKTVILSAAGAGRGGGIAAVASDGSVILALRDLPATSGSQVYETWVIAGGQAPLPVGGFTVDSAGVAGFTTRTAVTPSGAVIALTLEPTPGSTAPTGPIVISGVAAPTPVQTS